jgi:hypothetical protein
MRARAIANGLPSGLLFGILSEVTRARASSHVRKELDAENYVVRPHFYDRMNLRGMFWPDVLSIVEKPSAVRTDGVDQYGRERWYFRGMTTARAEVELLCVFENDGTDSVIFWTIYWED